MGPSQKKFQFFTNCSSMGFFNRMQSLRKRLLWSVSCQENMNQHKLLSSWLHGSCQEPASGLALHMVTDSFGCIHGLAGDHHGLQRDSSFTVVCNHGLQGNLCPGCWSKCTPFFFTDLGSTGPFPSYLSFPSDFGQPFFSFLNTLSQRWYHDFRCLSLGQC